MGVGRSSHVTPWRSCVGWGERGIEKERKADMPCFVLLTDKLLLFSGNLYYYCFIICASPANLLKEGPLFYSLHVFPQSPSYASHLIQNRVERNSKHLRVGFLGCHDKVLQGGWLRTTKIYCITVLEIRNVKSRCQWGPVLAKVARKWSVPGLSPSFG